ncbi:MAG: tetratricopeptide repeat protein [Bacteroidia bacterium]|nr:tetratricopeptide repeat protein [Bacteroidia bacterium]
MPKHSPLYLLFLLLSVQLPAQDLPELSPEALYHNDSLWNMTLENPPLAVPYGKQLLSRALKERNIEWCADISARLSVAYDLLGYKDSAAYFALRALPVYETLEDLADMAFVYNGLGLIYYSQKQYPLAISYHKRSLDTEIQLKNLEGVASSMVNLGICYAYLDSTERTIRYYLQADSIYRNNGMEQMRSGALSNLLNMYLRLKEYDRARTIMNELKKLPPKGLELPEDRIMQLNLEASLLLNTGQPQAALALHRKATALAEQFRMREKMRECYEKLAENHARLQRYDSAYHYLFKSTGIGDSLYNVQLAAQVNDLSLQYETEKKDRALAELRVRNLQDIQKQRLQDEELREKKLQIYILGLLIFIASGTVLALAYIVRTNRRNNRLLQEKNRLIEENLQHREILLGEVHHRVKNNLQLVVSILQLQARSLDDEKVRSVLDDCIHRIHTMGRIHRQLYTGDNPETVAIRPFIQEIAEVLGENGKPGAPVRFESDIEALQLPLEYAVPLGLIINELLTNAAKYAFDDNTAGTIGVSLHRDGEQLRLSVYDNGKGMDPGSTGDSFGFRLIGSMVRQIGAEWNTGYSGGTRHIFFIPFTGQFKTT